MKLGSEVHKNELLVLSELVDEMLIGMDFSAKAREESTCGRESISLRGDRKKEERVERRTTTVSACPVIPPLNYTKKPTVPARAGRSEYRRAISGLKTK